MDNTKENLSERYRDVLHSLVLDYIQTAAPISSQAVAKKCVKRLSPATIRNIMADLETMGYLAQPHTSAGRIPTDQGFRFYVDSLVERKPLSPEQQEEIRSRTSASETGVRDFMQKTSKMLAAISHYAGLVSAPQWGKTIFKQMEFLPLSKGRLLGIFVAQSGLVENRIIETPHEFNFRELEKINNYCNNAFYGLTLEEAKEKVARELVQSQAQYDQWLSRALLLAADVLNPVQEPELFMEGESQLLDHPEFGSMAQMKQLMSALEEKQQLLALLEGSAESQGVQIFIGAENEKSSMKNLSLVTAQYRKGDAVVGTLGVIGPTRMDYARVIPIVDFTAQLVSRFF